MTYIITVLLEMHLKDRHEASFSKIGAKSNHSCILSCLTIFIFAFLALLYKNYKFTFFPLVFTKKTPPILKRFRKLRELSL